MNEPEKSKSIQAIELTRNVFESIHGSLGLLKFNIEKLTSKNGTNGQDSKKWEIICSFYETLGSKQPSKYKVDVNLDDNIVSIEKLNDENSQIKKFKITEQHS
jgi:hypothetical protein